MEVPPPAAAPSETASAHSSVMPFAQSLTQSLETGVAGSVEEPSSQGRREGRGVRFSKKREDITPLKVFGGDESPPSLSGEPTSPQQRSPLRSPSGSLQAPRQTSPGLPRQNSAPSDTSSGIMASASVIFNPLEKRGGRKFGTLKQQHLATVSKPGSANASAGDLNALHRSPAATAADAGWEGLAAGSAEVTQAEYSNYARMFNTFDTDGSGSIDVDELSCIMNGLNIQLDADELQDMMQRYGRPGAGAGSAYVIDFPEFVEMMSGHKAKLMLEGVLRPEDGNSRDPLDNAYIQESLSSKYYSVDSSVRWLTDALLFLSMCYYSVTVPIWWCYDVLDGEALTVVAEVFFHGVFVWDVVLRFNTISEARVDDEPGAQDSDEVTRGAIARRYLRSTFVLDALTSIPVEFFFVSQSSLWPQFFRALKLVKLVKIPGLYGTTGSLRVLTPANITFVYSFVPIINLIFWLSIMCHWFTIGWSWLSEDAEKDSVQGLTEAEIVALISSRPLNYYRQQFSDQYLNSLYVVLYTLTTVGYGDVAIQTKGQKLLACGMFVTGAVCNGFVVSKINKVLSRTDIQSERKAKMVEMVNLLRFFRIPRYVQREILAFQYHLLDNNLSSAYSEIIDALPNNMQDQLSLYLKIKLVSKVPLFNQVHEECKIAIAQALRNSVATPSEFIICAGEIGNEMFFIGYGIAEVLRPTGQHLATIQKGQFFGEMAMLFARDGDSTRTASVRALTYCDLYCLIKASFLEILARFPIFRKMVDREASARGIGSPKSPGKESKPAWDKQVTAPECQPPPPHPAAASPANPLPSLPLPLPLPPPPLSRQHQRQEGRGATPVQSRSEGSVDKWGEAVLDAEGISTPLRAGGRRATVTSRRSFTDEDEMVVCESLSFKSLWKNGDNMSRMKSGRSLRGSHMPQQDGGLPADHDVRLAKIEALLVRLVHRQSGMSGGDDELSGRREHSGEPFIAIQRTQSIHSTLPSHRVEGGGGGGGGGGTFTPLSTPVR